MFKKLKWLFTEWMLSKKERKVMAQHILALQAQFKYLQQRIDRMEVPR